MPHAYVNLYLTPPSAQAVAPHADDRDVLVWQAAGSKCWSVYGSPIPFPYPEEQVGKSDSYPVPEKTLETPLLEVTLHEGDVLYMPRGYVHEAKTSKEEASLHLTIALATHDWSWPSVAAAALQSSGVERSEITETMKRMKQKPELRKSVPPALICAAGAADSADSVHAAKQMDSALENLSVDAIARAFAEKACVHNSRQDACVPPPTQPCVTIDTFVRRLTAEEKQDKEASAGSGEAAQQGLMARDEIADVLPQILGSISTHPVRVCDFQDAPLLCSFSKVCFAKVCIDMGLLCACDSKGARLHHGTSVVV